METIPVLPPPRPIPALPDYIQSDAKLRDAAQKLEATFLAEMLKSAGLGAPRDTFGGGVGEDQFSSFLREAQAEKNGQRRGHRLSRSTVRSDESATE